MKPNRPITVSLLLSASSFLFTYWMVQRVKRDRSADDLLLAYVGDRFNEKVQEIAKTGQGVPRSLIVDFSSTGYLAVEATPGQRLYLSPDGATPLLDGYTLKLQVGNPSSASLNGLTFHLRWSTNETTIEVPATVSPGYWQTIEIPIAPASAADLHTVTLSLETKGIFMKH